MQLLNRRIYGITLNDSFEAKSLYVNFGESRYAYITFEQFVKYAPTWKFDISKNNTENWQPLLSNFDKLPRSYYFDLKSLEIIELMATRRNFIKIEDQIIHFKSGQYSIELNRFFKLKSGSIVYKNIKSYKKHTIKLNLNGTLGFSIWKGKTCLEDNIWSIAKCEKIIEEMNTFILKKVS